CVEADAARLVLEVELDRIDPTLVDHLHDRLAQARRRPGVDRDVDGSNGRGRGPGDQLDGDRLPVRVAEAIARDKGPGGPRAKAEADREAALLESDGAPVHRQARAALEASREPDRPARLDLDDARERNGRRRRVDREAPAMRARGPRESAVDGDGQPVLAVAE